MLYADNWEAITDNFWLLEVVRRGYKLHFLQQPCLVIHSPGCRFHLTGKVTSANVAISKLLVKRAISTSEESDITPRFCSPAFLVFEEEFIGNVHDHQSKSAKQWISCATSHFPDGIQQEIKECLKTCRWDHFHVPIQIIATIYNSQSMVRYNTSMFYRLATPSLHGYSPGSPTPSSSLLI